MTEPEQPEGPLSETELCVRFKGSENFRIMRRSDLSGNLEDGTDDQLVWSPGTEIAYAYWLYYAGSEERAKEVLSRHAFEFELVGPGAETFEGEEEFAFEVKD